MNTESPTRTTRKTELAPGTLIQVEVIGNLRQTFGTLPDDRRLTAMNETTRHEILSCLERLGKLAPEMRFGQLIANLAFMAAGPCNETLWDLEDDQLLAAIRQMDADLSQRDATATAASRT